MDVNCDKRSQSNPGLLRKFSSHQLYDVIQLMLQFLIIGFYTLQREQHTVMII